MQLYNTDNELFKTGGSKTKLQYRVAENYINAVGVVDSLQLGASHAISGKAKL